MTRHWQGESLVDGTCATVAEFRFWKYGLPGTSNGNLPAPSKATFCGEADPSGCELMRQDGRCPHDDATYERIVTLRAMGRNGLAQPGRKPSMDADTIRTMRQMVRDGAIYSEVSERFGVSIPFVGHVVNRRRYAWVDD